MLEVLAPDLGNGHPVLEISHVGGYFDDVTKTAAGLGQYPPQLLETVARLLGRVAGRVHAAIRLTRGHAGAEEQAPHADGVRIELRAEHARNIDVLNFHRFASGLASPVRAHHRSGRVSAEPRR